MDEEPPSPDHPLLTAPRTVITPHIGSRTYENVIRQATMAAQNMINVLEGQPALAQANKV
jgi:D-3-phosphoglycerate dehydrogenase